MTLQLLLGWGVALQNAMNVVQISKEDQEQSFEMLSAVLWLGNINFRVVEHDSHAVVDDNDGKHQPSFPAT